MDGSRLPTIGVRGRGQVRQLLASPRLPLYLVALVVSLGLPALEAGLGGDDYMQRVWLLGRAQYPDLDPVLFHSRPVLELHVSIDSRVNQPQMDVGVLPWWSAPDLHISCFRVLTALTHWVDHRLWRDSVPLMHAHSLGWAALCVLAASFLYRRLLAPTSLPVAGLAACLFAVDSARGTASYLLAYRNGLVALFFCILTLLAHWRRREEGWKPGTFVAPLLLAAALLSGEVALATLAYLVAYAVCLDRGTPGQRARTLIPYVAVVLLWQLLYVGMGHGVSGSSDYMHPAAEPLRFLAALLERGPFYLLGQWVDLDVLLYLLGAGRRLWVLGLVSSLVVGAACLPLLRGSATARFWALGMLLCLVPVCATTPTSRRLIFAGLGAAGLLAQLFAWVVASSSARPRGRWVGPAAVSAFLAFSRLVLGPPLLIVKAIPSGYVSTLAEMPLDRTVERQTLVVLNPPTALALMALPFVQAVEGRAIPLRTRGLAGSAASGAAERTDERTLAVRVKGGFLSESADTVFRDSTRRMKPGDRIELTGVTVEVVTVKEGGRPWEVRFRFDVPLEDGSLRWVQWTGLAYAPLRLPAVGEVVLFSPDGVRPGR